MKRLGLIIVSCIFSLLSVHTLYAQGQDKLLQLLKQELAADMQELQKQENPPYHMNFRVTKFISFCKRSCSVRKLCIMIF